MRISDWSSDVCSSDLGGMVTAFLKGGLDEARRFLERVEVFALAESLGGVESLIEHPAIMTHASIPPENRAALDRKSVVEGKSVSVRVDLGGRRLLKKKKIQCTQYAKTIKYTNN